MIIKNSFSVDSDVLDRKMINGIASMSVDSVILIVGVIIVYCPYVLY